MTDPAKSVAGVERRPDIDWIRALLVLGLTLFHTARIFDLLPFLIKNEQQSLTLMVLVGFVSQWGMPLFFVIAGIAAWHSLEKRTVAGFVWDRFRRLVVPFVFGLVVLVPPQLYYTLRANPDYNESYWQFYPNFFRVVFKPAFPEFIAADPAVGLFGPAHLWFLYYLFVFSMLLLPLFVYLRGAHGRSLSAKLAGICQNSGGILMLALPAIVIETFVVIRETPGWNRYAYLAFLVYGFLFAADQRFEEALSNYRNVGLFGGIATVLGFFAMSVITYQAHVDPTQGFTWEGILWRLLKSCSAYLWIMAILGSVYRYKNRRRPSLKASSTDHYPEFRVRDNLRRYVNEAVMPFYIIHQTVIVVIGFYIVRWQTNLWTKYIVILIATLAITLLLFEIIRLNDITRILFGMKLKKSGLPTSSPVSAHRAGDRRHA